MEERKRLTKDIKNVENATISELLINSCYYDEINDNCLTFRHLTDFYNAHQLLWELHKNFENESCIVLPDDCDDEFLRGICIDNAIKDIYSIDGLLSNFFCLIEANAKLRERLKEYEDKEFGDEGVIS